MLLKRKIDSTDDPSSQNDVNRNVKTARRVELILFKISLLMNLLLNWS